MFGLFVTMHHVKEKRFMIALFWWIVELPYAYIYMQWEITYLTWSSIYTDVHVQLREILLSFLYLQSNWYLFEVYFCLGECGLPFIWGIFLIRRVCFITTWWFHFILFSNLLWKPGFQIFVWNVDGVFLKFFYGDLASSWRELTQWRTIWNCIFNLFILLYFKKH